MSWDAYLFDDRGHCEGEWNYTHNTNKMIAEALISIGYANAKEIPTDHPIWNVIGPPWWKYLDCIDGPNGAKFLTKIISELQRDPVKYEAMNPSNGWGSYDTLIKVFNEMILAVPEWPTKWSVRG